MVNRTLYPTSDNKTSMALTEIWREINMVKLMFWVCLILVFHIFASRFEARPLNPFVEAWNPNKSLQPMLVGAKAVKTYVIHLLGTYVTILCNWLIL